MSRAKLAIAALVIATGCTGPGSDPPRIVLEKLATDPERWQATYRFDEPVSRLRFQRPARFYRETVWEIVTPGYAFERGEDGTQLLVAEAGTASDTVVVRFPVYVEPIAKEYELFGAFTDGSVAIYTGHFYAAFGEQDAEPEYLRRLELVPAPGDRLVVQGRTAAGKTIWEDPHGDGTYAYFGGIPPLETDAMIAIVDPGAPEWLRQRLDRALPELFETYTTRFGEGLPWKPVVLFNYIDNDSPGLSSGGGTLTGLIQMFATGEGWADASPSGTEHLLHLLAHEAVHLWNGQLYGYEGQADTWMHEGSADAFAERMLHAEGAIDDRRLADRRTEALNLCVRGLRDGSLATSIERGAFDNFYKCGNMIALWTVAATEDDGDGDGDPLFAFWRELFERSDPDGRYDRETYFEALAAKGASSEDVAHLRAFVDEVHDDPASAWIELFERVGVRLERLDRAIPELRSHLGGAALQHLMGARCDGRYSFNYEGDRLRTFALESCPPFDEALKVVGIEGHAIRDAGDLALAAVAARCARGQTVRLGLEDGGSRSVGCSSPPAPEPTPLRLPRLEDG